MLQLHLFFPPPTVERRQLCELCKFLGASHPFQSCGEDMVTVDVCEPILLLAYDEERATESSRARKVALI